MSTMFLRAAYLRMEDGEPVLVLVRDDAVSEVFSLRPEQVLAFAKDAACMLWGHYDLVQRK